MLVIVMKLVEYCKERACLCVFMSLLSVHEHFSGTSCLIFLKFLCMSSHSSSGSFALIMYFRFCGYDVMLARNGQE